MKVGDYEIEVTSERINGGWRARGCLPSGKSVTSAPSMSREDAEHDVEQQMLAQLYPQRRYDVNRPFESQKPETDQIVQQVANYLIKVEDSLNRVTREEVSKALGLDMNECNHAFLRLNQYGILKRGFDSGFHHPVGEWSPKSYLINRQALNSFVKDWKHPKPQESMKEAAIVKHLADQLLEAMSSDWVPPHQNFGNSDEEIDLASKHPWNAWEYAQRTKRQHPKLEQAVAGSPFEHQYKRFFQAAPRPKASFYPSDGGGGGGGGGFTSA